jgi:hypothetical protein
MVRMFVLYEAEPPPDRVEHHAELCRKVEGGTYRHGRVFGAPFGEPKYKFFGEIDFPDMDTFKAASKTPEFVQTGKDAMDMGIPFHVHFAEVE